MRKIWSSRKDRDKRKLMNPEPATAPAAAAGSSIAPAKLAIAPPLASAPAPDHLARLVRPEWDLTPMKHQWLNVAHGPTAHSGDIELSSRAYRAELRGSHLYLYKAPQFKRFALDDSVGPMGTPLTPKVDKFDDVATMALGAGTAVASIAPSTATTTSGTISGASIGAPTLVSHQGATPMGAALSAASTLTHSTHTGPYSQLNYSTATLDEHTGFHITHYSPSIHPQLQRNPETGKFGVTSVEALVHYMLFGDDTKAVASVINILPIVPQFSSVMQLIGDFVTAIAEGRFGSVDTIQVGERILQLLANIEANFGGFLLKKDTALLVLQVMEDIQKPLFAQDVGLEGRLVQFKLKMLVKQQQLMDLIKPNQTPSSTAASTTTQLAMLLLLLTTEQNPFIELNLLVFMKGNLFELAHAILKIDQQYFHQWNLNIDKLLLLFSLLLDALGVPNFYKRNPLLFNNDVHIHYLSRLLIHHLFVETSLTIDRKARLLEKWIDLGCLLDKLGNMLLWLGISLVILSQPVLRLIKVWLLVLSDYVKLLKNDWCPVLFELDRRHLATDRKPDDEGGPENLARDLYHIMAPRGLGKIYAKEHVIPYFGDLVINNDNPDPQTVNVDELQAVWKRINYLFSRWNEYLANLTNYTDIIKYNEEVLQRYDAMGFIFSNELLNQVLYLGVNGTLDDPPAPQNPAPPRDDVAINALHAKLVRLIDINTELINLDKIMKLSLELEPDLPELYLKPPEKPHAVFAHNHLLLLVLVHLVELGMLVQPLMISGPIKADRGFNRLPLFNNDYLKVSLEKYESPEPVPSGDLVFRTEGARDPQNGTTATQAPAADEDDDDVPGLGIDVDDLLNLDKWRSQRRDPANSANDDATTVDVILARHVPRAGTIDKLIDLLLIDAKYFEEGVHIDLTEYRFVFLLNYNLFISTKDLLDKLAYRFINSGNAVILIMKQMLPLYQVPPGEFPNWQLDTLVDLKELGLVDYELLLKIQINILKVLIVLINNFYGNFSVELINKLILIKLLKLFSNEILQWYNSNKIALQNLEKLFENLVNYYKKLKKLFVKKLYRPVEISKFDEYLINEFKFNNLLHEVPINRNLPGHKNTVKIDKFLLKFNKLLTVFYRGITIDDWMKVNKALELLFERNQLLDFNLQKLLTPEEFVIILNVFNYFELLVDQDKLLILKKFPLVFRKLFKLFFKFRLYLLIQLTDANILVEERLDRMKTLLIMVRISQDKMRNAPQVYEGDSRTQMIPLCIETAVTTVIYLPELRVYSQYWLRAAALFFDEPPASFDNLELLLPPSVPMDDALEPLLPCFGWIIENLLQINTVPLFVDGSVINFLKRYLVFRFLKLVEAPDLMGDIEPLSDDTREFDFLLKLDEALVAQNSLTIGDYRDPHNRELRRLFRLVLQRQHDILLRDYKKKQMRDQMTHFSGLVPQQLLPYVTLLLLTNNILTKKSLQLLLRRQSLLYKLNLLLRFKILGFFSKLRPFSLNGGHHNNSNQQQQTQQPAPPVSAPQAQPLPPPIAERVVSERELPHQPEIDPKQKPSVVITLKNRKIFPVYLTPLCFKVDGDNGEDFFFQARLEPDFNDWLVKLGFANRHWFFSRMLNHPKLPSNLTFGVPLAVTAARDAALVPHVLTAMMKYIEDEGINDVGVYRILCLVLELTQLKNTIDNTGTLDLSPDSNIDVHAVTLVLKLYLRELPDALLTDQVIEGLFAVKQEANDDEMVEVTLLVDYTGPGVVLRLELVQYQAVLKNLPTTNYHTFRVLLLHLTAVATNQATNKMTPLNLATVIGPALTEALLLDSLVNKFGYINQVLEKMIVNLEQLFDPEYAQTLKQQIMGGGTIATVTGTPVTPAYPSTIIGTPVLNQHSRPAHLLDKIDDADERDPSDADDSGDEAVPHHSHGRAILAPQLDDEDPRGTIAGSASPPSVDALGLPTPTINDEDYSVNA